MKLTGQLATSPNIHTYTYTHALTGCLLDRTHESLGFDLAASSRLAAQMLSGLKPCLLDSCHPALQAAACRLLGAVASRCHPRLAQQLIQADLPEYLFEVLRGTTAITATATTATAAVGTATAAAATAAMEAASELTRLAVVALSYLALEGALHRSHRNIVVGLSGNEKVVLC